VKRKMDKKVINILIVDDEIHALRLLVNLLDGNPEFSIVGTATSASDAKTILDESRVDIVLLDIEMPGEDGFDLVSYMWSRSLNPGIIIISAFEKYALKAIKNSVFDYHLKPVSKDDLLTSLRKYNSRKQNSNNTSMEHLSRALQLEKKRLRLPDMDGYQIIDPAEVLFIEADGNYSEFILFNKKTICVSKNIGSVVNSLPDNFVRVSRKHIVNIDHIKRINKKSGKILIFIGPDHSINISRGYKRVVEADLARFFL
jgi:two-component system LytT family response regulator